MVKCAMAPVVQNRPRNHFNLPGGETMMENSPNITSYDEEKGRGVTKTQVARRGFVRNARERDGWYGV